jgi:hypothetical protein
MDVSSLLTKNQKEEDNRRNSTNRRVSFAATAHVRLFEKEDVEPDHEEQELAKTLAKFHPEKTDLASSFESPMKSK